MPAQAEPVSHTGVFQITGSSGNCNDYDPKGDEMNARYRPFIPGSNENTGTRLGLFSTRGAAGYRLDAGQPEIGENSKFKEFSGTVSLGGGFGPFDPVPRVRYISQKPEDVGAKTQFILITGEIDNYDYMRGCIAKFRLAVTKDF